MTLCLMISVLYTAPLTQGITVASALLGQSAGHAGDLEMQLQRVRVPQGASASYAMLGNGAVV